jgi:uracil-DNA glycosylase
VIVGGLALRSLLGLTKLTETIGRRYDLHGVPVIPLPHPSGASSWPNLPANRKKLDTALALVATELGRIGSEIR